MNRFRALNIARYGCWALFFCHTVSHLAAGETIYDNFRSDGGVNATGYFLAYGGPLGARFHVPATSDFRLNQVAAAVQATTAFGMGPSLGVRVSVRQNTASNEPGAILDSVERTGILVNPPTFAAGTYAFSFQLHPLLDSNTDYWVVMESLAPDTGKPFWFANVIGVRDPIVEVQGGVWVHYDPALAPSPAFRVEATAVPEPSSVLIAICIFASTFACARAAKGRNGLGAFTAPFTLPGHPEKRVGQNYFIQ
jgi:hypothetical protein